MAPSHGRSTKAKTIKGEKKSSPVTAKTDGQGNAEVPKVRKSHAAPPRLPTLWLLQREEGSLKTIDELKPWMIQGITPEELLWPRYSRGHFFPNSCPN